MIACFTGHALKRDYIWKTIYIVFQKVKEKDMKKRCPPWDWQPAKKYTPGCGRHPGVYHPARAYMQQ
jgi:hypothetical protein